MGPPPSRSTIKDRSAADIQITAEQLISEARQQFGGLNETKSHADRERSLLLTADKEELGDYLQATRKKHEDNIRKDRQRLRNYTDYARFEAAQLDYRRMRSVMERAASVMPANPQLYLQFAELEAKAGFVNHALNVMHRAVGLLPREDSLWFKYLFYEQALGDEERTRAVFERWMSWEPKEEAWFAYVTFEERHGHTDRARDVYERYCGTLPSCRAYIKYAKWEESNGRNSLARAVFERAAGAQRSEDGEQRPEELGEEERRKPDLWLAFGAFEAKCGEVERARAVYLHALETVHEVSRGRIFAALAAFEKKLGGDGQGVESVVTERRRQEYEAAVLKDPVDYDAWFDLARLEEAAASSFDKIRSVYSRAQAHPPPSAGQPEKRLWRRFVYLFIYEALFEELTAKDVDRARAALKKGLDAVPHKSFTFAKLWILAAHLELRAGDLTAARKLMGAAIGIHPKDKTFRSYLDLELQLGQEDRCRILYEKYLQFNPANASTWAKFAELEAKLGEEARARALFEMGVSQATLDEPDKLWLRYVEFECATAASPERVERVRGLYERLLQRTNGHVKVWIAFAKYLGLKAHLAGAAREVVRRADEALKLRTESAKNEDLALLRRAAFELEESMLAQEVEGASKEELGAARARLAQRVERRRAVPGQSAEEETRFEDVLELVFPDLEQQSAEGDKQKTGALKLLEMAQLWKKQKQAAE